MPVPSMHVPQLAMQIEEIIVEGSAFGKKAVKSASMPPLPSTVLAQSDMASIWSHGMTAGRMPCASSTPTTHGTDELSLTGGGGGGRTPSRYSVASTLDTTRTRCTHWFATRLPSADELSSL